MSGSLLSRVDSLPRLGRLDLGSCSLLSSSSLGGSDGLGGDVVLESGDSSAVHEGVLVSGGEGSEGEGRRRSERVESGGVGGGRGSVLLLLSRHGLCLDGGRRDGAGCFER